MSESTKNLLVFTVGALQGLLIVMVQAGKLQILKGKSEVGVFGLMCSHCFSVIYTLKCGRENLVPKLRSAFTGVNCFCTYSEIGSFGRYHRNQWEQARTGFKGPFYKGGPLLTCHCGFVRSLFASPLRKQNCQTGLFLQNVFFFFSRRVSSHFGFSASSAGAAKCCCPILREIVEIASPDGL